MGECIAAHHKYTPNMFAVAVPQLLACMRSFLIEAGTHMSPPTPRSTSASAFSLPFVEMRETIYATLRQFNVCRIIFEVILLSVYLFP